MRSLPLACPSLPDHDMMLQAAPQLASRSEVVRTVLSWWLSALFDDGPRFCLNFFTQAGPGLSVACTCCQQPAPATERLQQILLHQQPAQWP